MRKIQEEMERERKKKEEEEKALKEAEKVKQKNSYVFWFLQKQHFVTVKEG